MILAIGGAMGAIAGVMATAYLIHVYKRGEF